MNLCTCCFDEVTGTWCGCEEQHPQDQRVIEEAREYERGPRNMEVTESWSYYCTACERYISGTAYYTTA